jgi:ubiquinone/menaquinone biosynthesis C-methylase UbiE
MGTKTVYLSFRDVKGLLKPNEDWMCLDYGCGAGRSTRFLKSIGLSKVDSVDVSQAMLKEAMDKDPTGNYQLIESGKIAADNDIYDLVFSSFVFVEIGDKQEIKKIFKEAHRVLKKDGLFVIVTPSEEAFNPKNQWLSYTIDVNNFPHKSGDIIPIKIKDIDLDLLDYYWEEADFKAWGKEAGFKLETMHAPLGQIEDQIFWASEWQVSPYKVFIFKKAN